MWDSGHPHRWRTWVRSHLPWFLVAAALCTQVGCGLRHDLQQSRTVAEKFLRALQSGQYQTATQLLGTKGVSPDTQGIRAFWLGMQPTHGAMQRWQEVRYFCASGGSKHPRHTDLYYTIAYGKVTGRAQITIEPQDKTYRITSFEFE